MKGNVKLLKRLVEEINLIMRGVKGYGAGQPWSPRKPTEGLGKSDVAEFIEKHDASDSTGGTDNSSAEFEVSKVFKLKDRE